MAEQGHPEAADVVAALLHAVDSGDGARAYDLIDPDVVYLSTAFQPLEVRGRDAYVSFLASLQDLYTAPRSHEILGIEAHTPSMAALRVRVTVADVSVLSILFHYVRDGRVVELIDVIEDRGRAVAPYVDGVAALARRSTTGGGG